MTCNKCEDGCRMDMICDCQCHFAQPFDETEAVVFENQVIEYEVDEHLPDGMVITKTRIMVTGRDSNEAFEQFKRVKAQ